jgi:uncharacterized protein
MRADRIRLAIFARAPIPGRTKTRLARTLGDERAALLYGAFLGDLIALVAKLESTDVELWAASEGDRGWLEMSYPQHHCQLQRGGDLGARLMDALERCDAVIGSDLPTLPLGHLVAALDATRGHDSVIGPCDDGGYWMLGARIVPDLSGIRWSTEHALADTRARLGEPWLAPPWYDVDVEADLERVRADLRRDALIAPMTRAVLASFDRE